MPGPILGSRGISVNKSDKLRSSCETYILLVAICLGKKKNLFPGVGETSPLRVMSPAPSCVHSYV